jgi:adenylyltransferase/sulfurtransferase
MTLTSEERLRYQRQLIMPEIGAEGQERLKRAKVFLCGLGGLGSVSAYYLVAAGIGHLRVVDMDVVELQNLNRQILHGQDDVGIPKIDSAKYKLERFNGAVQIDTFHKELREENALDLVGDSELIIDATDNLKTRKILNRVSLNKGIPLILGGVEGFNGMVTTCIPGESPCFECIFPSDQSNDKTIGVLGPVPGFVASVQSLEAIKVILGRGKPLKGRLLLISGADMTFKEIKVDKNPECPVCSQWGSK